MSKNEHMGTDQYMGKKAVPMTDETKIRLLRSKIMKLELAAGELLRDERTVCRPALSITLQAACNEAHSAHVVTGEDE